MERVATKKVVLMCAPTHFTVAYRINPWMNPDVYTSTALAVTQWTALRETYKSLGITVHQVNPVAGLPDMVFTANGGFCHQGVAYGASFHHAERRPEAAHFNEWFTASYGLKLHAPLYINEGEGDFLLVGNTILAGTGFRSDAASHDEVAKLFGLEVVPLTLVDPRFYHLDTALAVVDDATIAYFPGAFDARSNQELQRRFPDAIIVDEKDALVFGLNAFSDGKHVITAARATGFAAQLRERGFEPVGVELSELLRGGGGAKCCTLELR